MGPGKRDAEALEHAAAATSLVLALWGYCSDSRGGEHHERIIDRLVEGLEMCRSSAGIASRNIIRMEPGFQQTAREGRATWYHGKGRSWVHGSPEF